MFLRESGTGLRISAPPVGSQAPKTSDFLKEYACSVRGSGMKTMQESALERPRSARYRLLSRLQDWDDQEVWRDFFETYWRLIYSTGLRSGLTDQEAQDVVQETVISIAKYAGKSTRDRSAGSFK